MTELMSQACERCWRRKQKCSRETPVCLQCRTASANCVRRRFGSTIDGSDIGNETYIESLKTRVRNLQRRVQHEPQDCNTNIAFSHPRSFIDEESHTGGVLSDGPSVDHRPGSHQRNDLQDTMQEASYLSLSAMAERTDRQPVPTNGLSFLTLLHAATGISGSNPTLPLGSNKSLSGPLADFRKTIGSNIEHLDNPEVQNALQHYVDIIWQSFPFMTKTELIEQYEGVIQARSNGTTEGLSPENLILTYLGIATGILLSPNYTYKEVLATEFAARAIQSMSDILDNAGNLSIVRCLTALTIHSLFTTFGGSTWHLLGLTMTRSIASGMHTVRVSDPHSENEEKRQSSRAFWTLYILDTYVSTTLDRPFCLNDHEIMISAPPSPPSKISEADNETAMYQHLMQHAQIIRSIHQSQNSASDLLCHFINLRHWKETFPSQGSKPTLHYVHLCTHGYVQLLLHPTFINEPDRANIFRQAEEEFNVYLDLVEDNLTSQSSSIAGIDALHIFAIGVLSATRSQLFNAHTLVLNFSDGSTPSQPSVGIRRVSQALNILTLLSTRYAAVRSLRDVLSELQWPTTQDGSREQLRLLAACSEIAIPRQVQALIMSDGRSTISI